MKKILAITCLLAAMITAAAQTYDTVSAPGGRLPGFHYSVWFDTCPAFYDSIQIYSESGYEPFLRLNTFGWSPIPSLMYYHSDSVDHLAAIIGFGVWQIDPEIDSNLFPWYVILNKPRVPEYVKLAKYDRVNNSWIHLDSVRWDTAAPKIMKVPLNYDTVRFPPKYVKLYEVHLDTPIYVDSTFFLGGTQYNDSADLIHLEHIPTHYPLVSFRTWGNPFYPSPYCPDDRMLFRYYNNRWTFYTPETGPVFGGILPIIDYSWIELQTSDSLQGRVDRSRQISKRVNYTFSATADHGYRFSHWQDGDTNNPRTIFVTQDTSFTAYFEPTGIPFFDVSVSSNNPHWGTAEGSGIYDYGDQAVLTATATDPLYCFYHWQDGDTNNPRYVTITQDSAFVAYFDMPVYEIQAETNNPNWGYVTGGGSYNRGDVIELQAFAKRGTESYFSHWQDSSTRNPRRVTVTQDSTFIAYFVNYDGITQVDSVPFRIFPNPASSHVTVACRQWQNSVVTIQDAAGREYIRTRPTGVRTRISTANLAAGVYFVSVANAAGTSVRKLVIAEP